MKRQWHAIVVVPARDEAAVIERCVRSVRRAAMVTGPLVSIGAGIGAECCVGTSSPPTWSSGTAHSHVHGANLGVRADAYLAVGGWDDIATGEDHDLWRRMSHRHAVISTSASFVRTSARRIGRSPDGFAADLVALAPTLAVTT